MCFSEKQRYYFYCLAKSRAGSPELFMDHFPDRRFGYCHDLLHRAPQPGKQWDETVGKRWWCYMVMYKYAVSIRHHIFMFFSQVGTFWSVARHSASLYAITFMLTKVSHRTSVHSHDNEHPTRKIYPLQKKGLKRRHSWISFTAGPKDVPATRGKNERGRQREPKRIIFKLELLLYTVNSCSTSSPLFSFPFSLPFPSLSVNRLKRVSRMSRSISFLYEEMRIQG